MSKIKCIGIIAEDNSDFETVKILIQRMLKRTNLSFKRAIGNGCGRLKKKALDFAINLEKKGCDMLILIHDLDNNIHQKLHNDLIEKIKNAPIKNKFVCIPIEEIEAWFLSDPNSIKTTFKLIRRPKFQGKPETISSPKEKLAEQIYLCSNKSITFLNTRHNQKLAEQVTIDLVISNCESFFELHSFLTQFEYI